MPDQFAQQFRRPRYTMKYHEEYARGQRVINQDHERRLTILENRNGR